MLAATSLGADAAPLWLAERDQQRLFLLGSIHVLGQGTVADDPLLAGVYDAVDNIVLELDLTTLDPGAVRRLVRKAATPSDGRTLAEMIGPQYWPDVQAAAASANIDLAPYTASEPWHAAMLITRELLRREGYDGRFGTDAVVGAWARRDNKPVTGLETASEQIGFFDRMSVAAQRELLLRTLNEADELSDDMAFLATAWRAGDIAAIEHELYPDSAEFPELEENLLAARNRVWLERIASIDTASGSTLIVVGALHLTGPASLLTGLEERGFVVSRLGSRSATNPESP